MAINRLTPRHFTDEAIFAAEQRIFRTHWHLVGLTRDLPEALDWFLIRIGSTEIIVQNAGDGEIRAFTNVCPHRYSALVTEAKGTGKLRCPYHLWSFDIDGIPAAVPLRGDRHLAAYQTPALSLRQWSVSLCGTMIFIAEAPVQPLTEFLGPLVTMLETMSSHLGAEVHRFSQDIAANWKTILQNTVEFDHAFSVHPETFAPMVERPLTIIGHETLSPHIAYHTVMRQKPDLKPMERRIAGIFARSTIPMQEGYFHASLFPSATIGTTENRQFALITYQPVSAGVTRADYRLFVSQIADLTSVEQTILDQVIPTDVAFTKRLLEEDRIICETVQRGMRNAPDDLAGILQPGEALVQRFQHHWFAAMAATH